MSMSNLFYYYFLIYCSQSLEKLKKLAVLASKSQIHFIKWWHLRRLHFVKAFRPENCPKTNLSESRHASQQARGAVNLTLVEAAVFDATEDVFIQNLRDQISSGLETKSIFFIFIFSPFPFYHFY